MTTCPSDLRSVCMPWRYQSSKLTELRGKEFLYHVCAYMMACMCVIDMQAVENVPYLAHQLQIGKSGLKSVQKVKRELLKVGMTPGYLNMNNIALHASTVATLGSLKVHLPKKAMPTDEIPEKGDE